MQYTLDYPYDNKKLSEKELIKAADFYIDLIFYKKKRFISKTNIEFTFDDEYASANEIGCCIQNDKNNFIIWLRKSKSNKDQLITLAHELVHVKQYVMGELTLDFIHAKKTKGLDPYWDSPFEIEAFGRQEGLYHRYVVHHNKQLKT